ncbi:MAG: ATP-binding cassette domain-containing protein [Gemmatimonadetes bacterium]|nr:ATP-binding cassette domain-containing protein [Gemmatimonadota bacterium]MBP7549043.1 ATP-binding cassette domain-containing protein [Gemmatimonadaceae bacterium]
MTPATAFLSIRSVEKTYATVRAVAGLSLDVVPGEMVALLGPNGAGKTTLLRMLVGITRPDRGQILWEGVEQAPAPGALGYLPEDRGLYQDVPIGRTLSYFARLRGIPAAEARRLATEWLERLDLKDRAGEKLAALSKGNQQKVQFAAAVLHRPRFAILDEPFSGLDPLNQELFLDLVRGLRDAGTAVLFSAHQMALVERLADRVFVMHRGRELLHGTTSALVAGGSLHDLYVERVRAANAEAGVTAEVA